MRFVILSLILLLLVSCATVFSGNTDEVSITSEPSDALVAINGIPVGRTPVSIELEKGMTHQVRIEKDGFEAGYAMISSRIGAGWVILDILAGLVPLVIDAATGSWEGLSPETVHSILQPAAM